MSGGNLERLLAPNALRVLFQPVVDVGDERPKLHCFEALTRGPAGSNFELAEVMFDYVRLRRAEAAMDRACVTAACAAVPGLPGEPMVSINVHAVTLSRDPEFLVFLGDRLTDNGIAAERLIVEVVEYAPHLADAQLQEALEALRRIGARLALDDIGLGHSNYRMLLELWPDYLKLDRHVVRHCYADFRRRAVIESLMLLARRINARVVAEGIEDLADLAAARACGVELVQGFLFTPPAPAAQLAGLDFLKIEAAERGRHGAAASVYGA